MTDDRLKEELARVKDVLLDLESFVATARLRPEDARRIGDKVWLLDERVNELHAAAVNLVEAAADGGPRPVAVGEPWVLNADECRRLLGAPAVGQPRSEDDDLNRKLRTKVRCEVIYAAERVVDAYMSNNGQMRDELLQLARDLLVEEFKEQLRDWGKAPHEGEEGVGTLES